MPLVPDAFHNVQQLDNAMTASVSCLNHLYSGLGGSFRELWIGEQCR
jgi:hypothetical protein